MITTKPATWLRSASFAVTLGLATLAPALAQTEGSVRFHDVSFDKVAVEVRIGPTEDQSIPYDKKVLSKGDSWNVDANLPLFWRRELNPGSGDGKFTAWQKVVPSGSSSVEISAA